MIGIDNETLTNIQQKAVEAAGATNKAVVLRLDREPEHIYGILTADGKIERRVADPAPRAHNLISLAEAVLFANVKCDKEKAVIWFDRGGLVILMDDETRRDRALLALKHTPQFALLQSIESSKKVFDQKEFRRLLRIDFAGCRQDDMLLNWVSEMQWLSNGNASGKLTHTDESLGRDIAEKAMSPIGECPEEISLKVRIFDDPAMMATWEIRCSIEILPKEERFRLLPLPLQLHDAIEREISNLGEELRKTIKCKIFRGKP